MKDLPSLKNYTTTNYIYQQWTCQTKTCSAINTFLTKKISPKGSGIPLWKRDLELSPLPRSYCIYTIQLMSFWSRKRNSKQITGVLYSEAISFLKKSRKPHQIVKKPRDSVDILYRRRINRQNSVRKKTRVARTIVFNYPFLCVRAAWRSQEYSQIQKYSCLRKTFFINY